MAIFKSLKKEDITEEQRVEYQLSEMISANFQRPDFYFHIELEDGNEMYIARHFVIYYKISTLGRPSFPMGSGYFDYSKPHVIMEYSGTEDELQLCSKINSALLELKKKVGY